MAQHDEDWPGQCPNCGYQDYEHFWYTVQPQPPFTERTQGVCYECGHPHPTLFWLLHPDGDPVIERCERCQRTGTGKAPLLRTPEGLHHCDAEHVGQIVLL